MKISREGQNGNCAYEFTGPNYIISMDYGKWNFPVKTFTAFLSDIFSLRKSVEKKGAKMSFPLMDIFI